MTAAQRFAAFGSGLSLGDIPEPVADRAKLHLLDTLGCGFAAAHADAGVAAHDAVAEDPAPGAATLLRSGATTSAASAALANGMLCHALDFDDTHLPSKCHVSTVVVPAALATAQAVGSTGAELVAAIVAGVETTSRIGMAAPGAFHDRGLHPTGVCGVFGATVAVAMLRGLGPEQTTSALGIAGSTAAGLFEYLADGTATKPFHAGWVAHAGIVAVDLARHGGTGPATVLEGRYGIFRALLGIDAEELLARQTSDLGTRWEMLETAIKAFPACHYTHSAIHGARGLYDDGLRGDDVASIELDVPHGAVGLTLEPAERKKLPETGYESKFSLPYCVASTLVNGRLDLASFTEPDLSDAAVLDLAGRTTYSVSEPGRRGPFFTTVTVRLKDGTTKVAEISGPPGTPEHPLSREALVEKFAANAGPVLGAATGEVARAVLDLENAPDAHGLAALVPRS